MVIEFIEGDDRPIFFHSLFFHPPLPVYLGSLATLELFVNASRPGIIYKSRREILRTEDLQGGEKDWDSCLFPGNQKNYLPPPPSWPGQLRHSHSRGLSGALGWQLPLRSPHFAVFKNLNASSSSSSLSFPLSLLISSSRDSATTLHPVAATFNSTNEPARSKGRIISFPS